MRRTMAGSGRMTQAANESQLPADRPKPATITSSPAYDGWRIHRYGPRATTGWPGSTSTVVRKEAPSAMIAQTRSTRPSHIKLTPAACSGSRGADRATSATVIAAARDNAIHTRVARSRSRRPLPRTASPTRTHTSSSAHAASVISATLDTVLKVYRVTADERRAAPDRHGPRCVREVGRAVGRAEPEGAGHRIRGVP